MNRGIRLLVVVQVLQSLAGLCCCICELNAPADATQIRRCADLFNEFQEALINSESNLYILQQTFFSSSQPPPSLLVVTYNIHTTPFSIRQHTIGWSSSPVFATISPETIQSLQTGILSLIFTAQKIAATQNITLTLNVTASELPPSLTSEEITSTLNIITERLKPYAIHQKKLPNWEGSNKGYIWDATKTNVGVSTIIVIIADILLILLTFIFVVKQLGEFRRHELEQGHQCSGRARFFWSVAIISIFTNAAEIVTTTTTLLHVPVFHDSQKVHSFTKVYLIVLLITAAIVGIGGMLYGFCYTTGTYCCSRTVQHIGMCNFFLFVFFTTAHIIPTFLLMLVYPAGVSLTVAFISATFYYMASTLASTCNNTPNNLCTFSTQLCYIVFHLSVTAVLALVMVLLMAILTYTGYAYSSELLLSDAFSILPSILLGIFGYFAPRTFRRNPKNKNEHAADGEESIPLQIAEQGRFHTHESDSDEYA